MTDSPKDSRSELFRELARNLHLAIGLDEPQKAIVDAFDSARTILENTTSFSISISEDGRLLADGAPVKPDGYSRLFATEMARANIRSLVFNSTLREEDIVALIAYFKNPLGLIGDFLRANGIKSIAAIEIGTPKLPKNQPAKKAFTTENISAERRIIDELSGLSPEVLAYLSQEGVLEIVSETFEGKGMFSESPEVAALDSLIERHSKALGTDSGSELKNWYRWLRRRKVIESVSQKGETDEGSSGFVGAVEELIREMKRDSVEVDLKPTLKAILDENLRGIDAEGVEVVYKYLVSVFEKNPLPGFLITAEVFVEGLFERADGSIVSNFTKNRISEKATERNSSFGTEFLSSTLLWLTEKFLSKGRVLQALNIVRVYDLRRKDNRLSKKLSEDAGSFFAGLTVGEPLESLVQAVTTESFAVSNEAVELIRMLDSKPVYRRLISVMTEKPTEFNLKILSLLKASPSTPALVCAEYISRLKKMPRDMSGKVQATLNQREICCAIRTLALLVGEASLPLIVRLADDTDPEVRFSALQALAYIGTEEAIRILVKWFYKNEKNWRSEIVNLLPRLDPQITVPILVQFFHSRRDQWIEIIRVVGLLQGESARAFLVDTLYLWNSYTTGMNSFEKEEFMLALLESISRCEPSFELKNALRSFISEWQDFDLIRGIKVILGARRDLVAEKARGILLKLRED